MANNRFTYQQVTNVSINKSKLLDIASDQELGKKDYKVLLVLFTELNGWRMNPNYFTEDPLNYKKIDTKKIADILCMTNKEVKKCIKNLIYADIIECGSSDTIKNGYRFTF